LSDIVFLTSFTVFSLLVYRNATDFYILILYPATLLTMFMDLKFFDRVFVSFRNKIISSTNRNYLTSLFESLLFFSPVSLLWLRIPGPYWIRIYTVDTIVSGFRGNSFSFSLCSMMLTISLYIQPL
jgi:hypothetical protein